MIRISLGEEPEILAEFGETWCAEAVSAKARTQEAPTRYKHEQIRFALEQETHSKCAYCECNIKGVAYDHIEHIIPKGDFPEYICVWSNLTLACPPCNLRKGTYFSEDSPLINPYIEDPHNHIRFFGPMAVYVSDRGKFTIGRIKLNRDGLLGKRATSIESINFILDLLSTPNVTFVKQMALKDDLYNFMSEEHEYSASNSDYIRARCAELNIAL